LKGFSIFIWEFDLVWGGGLKLNLTLRFEFSTFNFFPLLDLDIDNEVLKAPFADKVPEVRNSKLSFLFPPLLAVGTENKFYSQ